MSLKGKAAAIGIGELKPMRDPGDASALDLMAAVAAEAIADAGLEKKDIDGLLVGMASAGLLDDLPDHANQGSLFLTCAPGCSM